MFKNIYIYPLTIYIYISVFFFFLLFLFFMFIQFAPRDRRTPGGTPQTEFRRLAVYPGNIPANPANPDQYAPENIYKAQDNQNFSCQQDNTFWHEKAWSKIGKMKCKMAKMRLKCFMPKIQ